MNTRTPSPSKSKSKSRRRFALAAGSAGLAVLIGLALVSQSGWTRAKTAGSASDLPTVTVGRASLERMVVAGGTIQPLEFVDVGAQISGQLSKLHVKLGQRVQRGATLAEIDPTLNSAKLTEAEATLENLRAQRRAKQEQLVLADLQRKRSAILLAKDALARSEAEVIDSNYRVAATGVVSLDAQIKQAQALLLTARTNLGYTRIAAPIDGEVVSITAREGQTLNANQTAPVLMRLARLDTMTVWAQVPEAEVTRLAIGHPVQFSILGEPDKRREGKVRQILPAPEILNGVVFYNALFDVPNPDGMLKVQMTAQVFFVVDRAADVIAVPLVSLTPDPKGRANRYRVRVVAADGSSESRTIETGVKDGVNAQVIKGLAEGEIVLADAEDTPKRANRSSGLVAKSKSK